MNDTKVKEVNEGDSVVGYRRNTFSYQWATF
jgi:hypothetical protein